MSRALPEAAMPDRMPETGDVVIHRCESNATASFSIYAVPGPDQLCCATRAEAERLARSSARQHGVNVWFSEYPGGVTLLAGFRQPARQQPRRTPPSDAGVSVVHDRAPRTDRARPYDDSITGATRIG